MEGSREEERKVEVEKGRGMMGKEEQEGEEKKAGERNRRRIRKKS